MNCCDRHLAPVPANPRRQAAGPAPFCVARLWGFSCASGCWSARLDNHSFLAEAVTKRRAPDARGEIALADDLTISDAASDGAALIGQMFLGVGLYAKMSMSRDIARELAYNNSQFDCYCVECRQDSTFRKDQHRNYYVSDLGTNFDGKNAIHTVITEHLCQRMPLHKQSRVFIYNTVEQEPWIMKVGQYPSIEDLGSRSIERFRNILGSEYFSELHRANGLYAHGIGIGSFVYLRRIFERLVYRHYDEATTNGLNVSDFNQLRMVEKIKALESVLPPALVRFRAAYSILSKGLHELTESECKKYFGPLRLAIMTILEQDLEAKRRKELEAQLTKDLTSILAEIGDRPDEQG